MISRRRILSRSRDDLNLDSGVGFPVQVEEEEDVWYNKEKLYKVCPHVIVIIRFVFSVIIFVSSSLPRAVCRTRALYADGRDILQPVEHFENAFSPFFNRRCTRINNVYNIKFVFHRRPCDTERRATAAAAAELMFRFLKSNHRFYHHYFHAALADAFHFSPYNASPTDIRRVYII